LRLGDYGCKLSVPAGDPSLQHDGRSAAVQWNAYRSDGIACLHGCKEIGLALYRGSAAARWKAAARGHRANRVSQSHDRASMQHASTIAQLLVHHEFHLAALGRAVADIHSEEFVEWRDFGDFHDLSVALSG
jgi:hypothetical protein